jgi:hypothetical protein
MTSQEAAVDLLCVALVKKTMSPDRAASEIVNYCGLILAESLRVAIRDALRHPLKLAMMSQA